MRAIGRHALSLVRLLVVRPRGSEPTPRTFRRHPSRADPGDRAGRRRCAGHRQCQPGSSAECGRKASSGSGWLWRTSPAPAMRIGAALAAEVAAGRLHAAVHGPPTPVAAARACSHPKLDYDPVARLHGRSRIAVWQPVLLIVQARAWGRRRSAEFVDARQAQPRQGRRSACRGSAARCACTLELIRRSRPASTSTRIPYNAGAQAIVDHAGRPARRHVPGDPADQGPRRRPARLLALATLNDEAAWRQFPNRADHERRLGLPAVTGGGLVRVPGAGADAAAGDRQARGRRSPSFSRTPRWSSGMAELGARARPSSGRTEFGRSHRAGPQPVRQDFLRQ